MGVPLSAEAVLIVDNAQLHADPGALLVFRANPERAITLPPHCTQWLQPVDVASAKPFKDRFSTSVRSQTDQDLAVLFGMLNCGAVTTASAAMKERVTFVRCALDADQHTTTYFTCLKAFRLSGMRPLSPGVVLGRPEVRRSDDDPVTAIQVKHPDRAFTGSQELTSDAWASRGRECAGRGGLVAGDAGTSTVPAIDLVIGRNKFVRATPLGSFHAYEGNVLEGGPLRRSRK
jgi:hypothetical protein